MTGSNKLNLKIATLALSGTLFLTFASCSPNDNSVDKRSITGTEENSPSEKLSFSGENPPTINLCERRSQYIKLGEVYNKAFSLLCDGSSTRSIVSDAITSSDIQKKLSYNVTTNYRKVIVRSIIKLKLPISIDELILGADIKVIKRKKSWKANGKNISQTITGGSSLTNNGETHGDYLGSFNFKMSEAGSVTALHNDYNFQYSAYRSSESESALFVERTMEQNSVNRKKVFVTFAVPTGRYETVLITAVDIVQNKISNIDLQKKVLSKGISTMMNAYILEANKIAAARKKSHVFLCIGQSNMAGRAEPSEEDTEAVPQTSLFKGGDNPRWVQATNPVNRYSTVRKGLSSQKLGPCYWFARKYIELNPNTVLGLVVNARGGTNIDSWTKGELLYDQALERIKDASKDGEIRGVLWHQGEANRNDPEYLDKLVGLVNQLRTDLAMPELPFVAGEVYPKGGTVNGFIAQLPSRLDHTAVVTSKKTSTFDGTHFDRRSQYWMGIRYGNQMNNLTQGQGQGCGDGVVSLNEQCDDGDLDDSNDCTNNCRLPACGDGILWNNGSGAEQCDDGDSDNSNNCTNSCQLPTCGDDIISLIEQCDGSNLGGQSCQTQENFSDGTLSCNQSCSFDTSACREIIDIVNPENSKYEALHPINKTGRPVGGGEGYGDWVTSYDTLVTNKDELLHALENATSGKVIYVDDNAVIDLSEMWDIAIPGNITLASGRGKNGSLGALIKTTTLTNVRTRTLFTVMGPNVRITGLRFQGPTTLSDLPGCEKNEAAGITITSAHSEDGTDMALKVDNCEFWGWPQAGVRTKYVKGSHIHHNHFHHNQRMETTPECAGRGFGYGVVTDRGFALIEANLFNNNRHDIASTGLPASSYEARYNLVTHGLRSHSFDMHGCNDKSGHAECVGIENSAGKTIYIHQNTFLQKNKTAVVIRGIPADEARISNNVFRHANEDDAIYQRYATGNLVSKDNTYRNTAVPVWFVSEGGTDFWKFRRSSGLNPTELPFGDFDGDGTQDSFLANESGWYISSSGLEKWKVLSTSGAATSGYTLDQLRFGDFDGDGTTDVFTKDGRQWKVAFSGKGDWVNQISSGISLDRLGFGDFNGDGTTDIMFTNGSEWKVSYSAKSSWVTLKTSTTERDKMRFGDFDGDGTTDVFTKDGRQWKVAFSGKGDWVNLKSSGVSLDRLGFCDFNGDGTTDIMFTNGSEWKVSWSGQTGWQTINNFGDDLSDLRLVDVNGDGKCDVLRRSLL